MIGNASAFRINSDKGLKYYNKTSSNPNFKITSNGVLSASQIGSDNTPIEQGYIRSINTEEVVGVDHYIDPDMTAAEVQTVIDELAAEGGGTIVWKTGEFRYSQNTTVGGEAAAIELKSNIEYLGRGYGTHIVQDEKDINVFACEYDDEFLDQESAGEVENIRVANMRLDGNKSAFTDFSTRQVNNALWTPLARRITLEHLWIHDVHEHGIHGDAIIDSTVRNCVVWNTLRAYHIATRTSVNSDNGHPTVGPVRTVVDGCLGFNCEGGLDLPSARNCKATDCVMTGMSNGGYSFDGKDISFKDCDAINCGRGYSGGPDKIDYGAGTTQPSERARIEGGFLDVTAQGIYGPKINNLTIDGVTIQSSSSNGIYLDECQNPLITGGTRILSAGQDGIKIESTCSNPKISDVNATNVGDVALNVNCNRAEVIDVTISGGSGKGVKLTAGKSTLRGAKITEQGSTPLTVEGIDSKVSDVRVIGAPYAGVVVTGSGAELSNIRATECGLQGMKIDAANCTVTNCKTFGNDLNNSTNNDFDVTANGVNTIIKTLKTDSYGDAGTRTLRDGRGTNADDPSTTGQWNGSEAYAEDQNALIRDTSNNTWYRAVNGTWELT